MRNSQLSSRLIVASASPKTIADRSRTNRNSECGPYRRAIVRCCGSALWVTLSDSQISALQHLARAAGVLPRRRQRADDRARAGPVEGERGEHALGVGLAPPASASPSARAGWRRRGARRSTGPRPGAGCARRGCGRCRRPAPRSGRSRTATPRSGSARRCPSAVTGHGCCCCCWDWPTTVSLSGPGSCAGGSSGRSAAVNSMRVRSGSSTSVAWRGGLITQVSLEPPPWLEFTTSSPSGSATRVSPPGSTQTFVAVVDGERAQVDVPRARSGRRSASGRSTARSASARSSPAAAPAP